MGRLHPFAELRRHKRSFLKLATQLTLTRITDEVTARRLFVEHLAQALEAQP